MSLSILTHELARAADARVKLYLDLPAKEAGARFTQMFETLGSHPLVGVGALGGLIAVFAYAKALFELNALGVHSTGLLATGDIADFASRFAVPFILLVAAFISLVLAWTAMLKADHRRTATFLLSLAPGVVGLAFTCAGYYWWVKLQPTDFLEPTLFESAICTYVAPVFAGALVMVAAFYLWRVVLRPRVAYPWPVRLAAMTLGLLAFAVWFLWMQTGGIRHFPALLFGIAFVAAIVPAWPLLLAGMEPGVDKDQRWQYRMLPVLRSVSTAFGLLIVFSMLGTVLLFSASVSVLTVRNTRGPSDTDMRSRVLEHKQADPMLIDREFVRLSNVWLVKRPGGRTDTAGVDAPWGSGIARTAAPGRWWMLSSGDVACVRDGSPEELREVAPLRRFCSTAAKPNATPFPENSIAAYAVRMLGCAPENFTGSASAWVVRFPHDEPRKLDPKAELTETSWSIPAAFLTLPGLQGLRVLPQKLDRSQGSLKERLRNETPSSVWVLGFANTRGPAGHNLNLSERRAMRLRHALEVDVPTEVHRIKTRGLSEDTFAGMFGVQETEADRVAVAFFCRPMQ